MSIAHYRIPAWIAVITLFVVLSTTGSTAYAWEDASYDGGCCADIVDTYYGDGGGDIVDTYYGYGGNDIVDTYYDGYGNDIVDTYYDGYGNDIVDTYYGGGNDIVDTYYPYGNDIVDTYYGAPSQSCGGCYYSSSSGGYASTGYPTGGYSGGVSMKPVTVGHGVSVGRPSGGSYGSSYSTGYPVNISSGRSVGSTYPIAKPATIGYSYNYADNSITDNSINNSFNSGSNINSPYGVAAGTSINTIPAKPHYYNTGYSYSNPSPYVALSQIPYTGFDYGPLGNAMYWAALLSVAVAGAYLLVYYNGGALSLAQNYFTRTRNSEYSAHINAMDEVNEPKEAAPEIELDDEAIKLSASDRQPATRDTMGISTDGGIPRISILRA